MKEMIKNRIIRLKKVFIFDYYLKIQCIKHATVIEPVNEGRLSQRNLQSGSTSQAS